MTTILIEVIHCMSMLGDAIFSANTLASFSYFWHHDHTYSALLSKSKNDKLDKHKMKNITICITYTHMQLLRWNKLSKIVGIVQPKLRISISLTQGCMVHFMTRGRTQGRDEWSLNAVAIAVRWIYSCPQRAVGNAFHMKHCHFSTQKHSCYVLETNVCYKGRKERVTVHS